MNGDAADRPVSMTWRESSTSAAARAMIVLSYCAFLTATCYCGADEAMIASSSSGEPTAGTTKVTVLSAVDRIRLDGKLTEDSWLLASKLPLSLIHPGGASNEMFVGYFSMTYDAERLYVGFEVADSNLQARGMGHDQADVNLPYDLVMVFLDVNCDDEHVIELHVNPLGAINDIFCIVPRAESPLRQRLKWGLLFISRWDIDDCIGRVHLHGTLNKTGDTDKGWSGEVSIPFKALMLPGGRQRPDETDVWRVQFAVQRGDEERAWVTWMPSAEIWFHHGIKNWGRVAFRANQTAQIVPRKEVK